MTAANNRPTPPETPHADDQLLTLREVADLVRVPVATLRYWRHLGSGPRSFRIGRTVRYWRTDLVLWFTEQSAVDRERSLERATHPQPSRRRGRNSRQREAR